jgi:hypothetical protein
MAPEPDALLGIKQGRLPQHTLQKA